MRFYRILGEAVLCLSVLASCSESVPFDEKGVQAEKVPVKFSSIPHIEVSTRAVGENFEAGDELGIFAVDRIRSGSDRMLAYGNYADNVRYVFDSSVFTCAGEPIMQYKDTPLPLTYYIVYPYKAGMQPLFYFTPKTDQRQHVDYTTSDLAFQKIATHAVEIELELEHLMSNIDIRVRGVGVDTLDFDVAFTNVVMSTYVNLNNQSVSATGDMVDEVLCERYSVTPTEARFHAIIAPQQLAQGVQNVVIILDGVRTSLDLPGDFTLNSNSRLTLIYNYVEESDGNVYFRFGGVEDEEQEPQSREN